MLFNYQLFRHYAAAKHLQGVDPCGQLAHIYGAFAIHGEIHHHLAPSVKHHHADSTLFIVGTDSDLPLGGIGIHFRLKCRLSRKLVNTYKHVLVVAIGNHLARHFQDGVVRSITIGTGNTVDTIGVVGMTQVKIIGVELIEQFGVTSANVFLKIVIPHQSDTAWAPAATGVKPSATIFTSIRLGIASTPKMLVIFILPID